MSYKYIEYILLYIVVKKSTPYKGYIAEVDLIAWRKPLQMRLTTKHLVVQDIKRHLRPQAVPRGFLRAYMLSMLSRTNQTGYSIMQSINEKSKGVWRPGPGTIYPLLRTLAEEELVKSVNSGSKSNDRHCISYSITEKGRRELEQMQQSIIEQRTEDHGIMAVFVELFPASYLTSFYLKHLPWECEFVLQKVAELPVNERKNVLKETKAMFESQLSKVESELKQRR